METATRPYRKKKVSYTALGEIYQGAKDWQKKKVVEELREVGIQYSSFRAYLIQTPAYHAPHDLRDIVIGNFPESTPLFDRPTRKVSKES